MRWTSKMNIFEQRLVIVPVNIGAHWFLAALDMKTEQVRIYDSKKHDYFKSDQTIGENLLKYLEYEYDTKFPRDKFPDAKPSTNWKVVIVECQQQTNNSDCGGFLLAFSFLLLSQYKQHPLVDMNRFRLHCASTFHKVRLAVTHEFLSLQ